MAIYAAVVKQFEIEKATKHSNQLKAAIFIAAGELDFCVQFNTAILC